MSGITGYVDFLGDAVPLTLVRHMLEPLVARGPDRQSVWAEGPAGFGHALLTTTPEAACEHQPWVSPIDGCVVVADSRLDERPVLLKQLQLPDDAGDAQLIHAAWRLWGTDCVDKLLGDFAFALWDPNARQLFLARDPMGVRPLYIHHRPGKCMAFASEPDALLCVPGLPHNLNEERLFHVLVEPLEAIDKTTTFFAHIQRLPAAHWALVDTGGMQTHCHWNPLAKSPFPAPVSDELWLKGLHSRFLTAVQRRARASAPVGSMLSGGLDSSSVAAVAAPLVASSPQGRLHTFSAVSSEPGCVETQSVHAMLAHLPLQAHLVQVEAQTELFDTLAHQAHCFKEPFDTFSSLVACQYRTAAQHGVRVVLDGIDADNLLSEGPYMGELMAKGRFFKAWQESRGLAAFHGDGVQTRDVFWPALKAGLPAKLKQMLRKVLKKPRSTLARDAWLHPAFASEDRVQESLSRFQTNNALIAKAAGGLRAHSSIAAPIATVAVERYGRLAAMNGVEPRHPFLDRELVEYCIWMPLHLRLRGGWPKWALRAAMQSTLPAAVTWRKGKQHLGWKFNHQLYQRLAARPDLQAKLACAPLTNWFTIPEQPQGEPLKPLKPDHPSWETHFRLLSIGAWLNRLSGN